MSLLHELIAAQLVGGGGGGGSDGPLVVTVNAQTGAASKTFSEISSALAGGRSVVFVVPISGVYAYLTTVGILEEYVIQATGVADLGNEPTLVIYTLMYNNTGAINTRAVDAVSKITLPGTTPTLTPVVYTSYECGTLTSLTVTNPPATGPWSVRFTSGSTATVLTMPNTVVMPDGFEVEANTVYEINVLDNYALVASWPVASS